MVVREPSGELKKPNWRVKDRIIQNYFPRKGKKHYTLGMFEPENLQVMIYIQLWEFRVMWSSSGILFDALFLQ